MAERLLAVRSGAVGVSETPDGKIRVETLCCSMLVAHDDIGHLVECLQDMVVQIEERAAWGVAHGEPETIASITEPIVRALDEMQASKVVGIPGGYAQVLTNGGPAVGDRWRFYAVTNARPTDDDLANWMFLLSGRAREGYGMEREQVEKIGDTFRVWWSCAGSAE